MVKLKGYKVIGTCPKGKEDGFGAKDCDDGQAQRVQGHRHLPQGQGGRLRRQGLRRWSSSKGTRSSAPAPRARRTASAPRTATMAKLKGYKVIGTCPKGKEDGFGAKDCDELIVTDCLPGTSYEDYSSVDIVSKVMDITGGAG